MLPGVESATDQSNSQIRLSSEFFFVYKNSEPVHSSQWHGSPHQAIDLMPESEATRVSIKHDQRAEDDTACASSAEGWPRILFRLNTLIETGKTCKPP